LTGVHGPIGTCVTIANQSQTCHSENFQCELSCGTTHKKVRSFLMTIIG
jgi:hypothetical protein